MVYNPAMYQTYGNMYGSGYGMNYPQQAQNAYPVSGAQSYGAAQSQTPIGIIWVDGEVGAKAQQMPAGWPVNTPLPLWDTNDTIIYLKSMNQMGMPNPLQKIHYKMDEQTQRYNSQSQALLGSGDAAAQNGANMSEYIRKDEIQQEGFVRRDDLERMKNELMESINGISAANNGTARRNTKGE